MQLSSKKYFAEGDIKSVNLFMFFLLIFHCFFLSALSDNVLTIYSRVSFNLIIITSFFSVEKEFRGISGPAIAIAFITYWLAYFFDKDFIVVISSVLLAIVFIITVFNLLRQVASKKTVSADTLIQAISGYLLIGIVFSLLFTLIIRVNPESVNFAMNKGDGNNVVILDTLYFTFISLATVGYGDFLPVSPFARSMSAFMGITGQIYIATVIALLIGKFSSS
ncbi:MAG: hypothetical protein KBE86_02265, partial [Chitinophagales bacterium]|nr:hypothetical protein [Chitinophagales bacterium]